MDKYDNQIAKINKKKQKALEKQAKIQAKLDEMTNEDLKYQRAIQVGKINVARTIKNIFGLAIPFCAVLSMPLPFSNLVLGLLLGVAGVSFVTAIGAMVAEGIYEKEWRKYNQELFKREAKEAEAKLQSELHQDLNKTKETQSLIGKKVEQNLETKTDLTND